MFESDGSDLTAYRRLVGLLETLDALFPPRLRPPRRIVVVVDSVELEPMEDGSWALPEGACEVLILDEWGHRRFVFDDILADAPRTVDVAGVHLELTEDRLVATPMAVERLAAAALAPWVDRDRFDVVLGPSVEHGRFVLELQCSVQDAGRELQLRFVDPGWLPLTATVAVTGRASFRASVPEDGGLVPIQEIAFSEG